MSLIPVLAPVRRLWMNLTADQKAAVERLVRFGLERAAAELLPVVYSAVTAAVVKQLTGTDPRPPVSAREDRLL